MTFDDGDRRITTRVSTPGDRDFLYQLLEATMRPYVEVLWGWDDESQQTRFDEKFAAGGTRIVQLDGEDIGMYVLEEREDHHFLSEIHITPRLQGRGVGAFLVRRFLEEARLKGLPLRLQVLRINPARKLYERLGFIHTGQTETHYRMEAIVQPR